MVGTLRLSFAVAVMAISGAAFAPNTVDPQFVGTDTLITINYPYCYENPWDRATCLKDDAPSPGGRKGSMHILRGKK